MDATKSRYGFLTTYKETFFVQRVTNYRFQVSSPIRYDTVSRPDPSPRVSLREAFLYVVYLSQTPGSLWKRRIGRSLVRNSNFNLICCGKLTNHAGLLDKWHLAGADSIQN